MLNVQCERMRASKHAPRCPFYFLEPRHGLAEIVERGAVFLCDGAMKRTANVLTTLCRACREERGYVEIRSKQAQLAYVLRLREQNYSGEIYLHSLGGGGGRWFTLNPRSDSEDEGSVNY